MERPRAQVNADWKLSKNPLVASEKGFDRKTPRAKRSMPCSPHQIAALTNSNALRPGK